VKLDIQNLLIPPIALQIILTLISEAIIIFLISKVYLDYLYFMFPVNFFIQQILQHVNATNFLFSSEIIEFKNRSYYSLLFDSQFLKDFPVWILCVFTILALNIFFGMVQTLVFYWILKWNLTFSLVLIVIANIIESIILDIKYYHKWQILDVDYLYKFPLIMERITTHIFGGYLTVLLSVFL
jgi:hypothetical protein